MSKKKRKKKPNFELVPLPPDMYEKPVEWSRDPVVVACAFPGCLDDVVDEERVFCDRHFYMFLGELRTKATRNPQIREAIANVNG